MTGRFISTMPHAYEHDGNPIRLHELARRSGLSVATLRWRWRHGYRGADLVAPLRSGRSDEIWREPIAIRVCGSCGERFPARHAAQRHCTLDCWLTKNHGWRADCVSY